MSLSLIATKSFFKKLCAQYTTAKYRPYIDCESMYLHQENIHSYILYTPEIRTPPSSNLLSTQIRTFCIGQITIDIQ
jgi:hypothetical protein